jgi:hypothetical protein
MDEKQRARAKKVLESYAIKRKRYPRVSELKEKFKNTKAQLVRIKGTGRSSDRGKIMEAYGRLLNGVVDEKDLEIVRSEKARQSLLKKRISVQLTLMNEERQLAVIHAYGVLLEQSKNMIEFWLGRVIDSSGIENLTAQFKQEINAQNVTAAVTGKRGMVSKVDTEWSFA